MKIKNYEFERDRMGVYKPGNMKEIEADIEEIFKENSKILPKNKNSKILIKPNFNNDLNAMTGNSTDLRIIVSVLKSLKKRGYKKITVGEGSNCGISHIGIDVFKRIGIDKICKKFGINLIDFNKSDGTAINLETGRAIISKTMLNSDFIINLPKLKTHVEAGISVSCKNYMGAFKGVEKRKMHDDLPRNIVRLSQIIKTDLIIADGLIGMEGRGPGDGIPKKVGIIISGHNPFLMDLLCSKLMGLKYKKIPFLMEAVRKGLISEGELKKLDGIEKIANFKPGNKSLLDRILLNNFFIGIRFSKTFEKFFNKGILPWILFKMGVKQDKYILEEMKIDSISEKKNASGEEKAKIKYCLEVYCPMKLKKAGEKGCIGCMYCYQILPSLIKAEGRLEAIKMQNERFGKYIKED